MRTTIDLPPDLLRAAKMLAAERGMSLKELLARALSRELGLQRIGRLPSRVSLPLVGVAEHPKVDIGNADIFAAEDAEKSGGV